MDSTQRKDDRSHSSCFRIIPSSSNVNLASSNSISLTSIRASSHTVYSCVHIENLLKKEKDRFVVINNINRKLTSAGWLVFGFPAIIDSNGGPPERIYKFVSCRNCYKTYSFASNSIRFLLDHISNSSDFNDQSNTLASMPSTSVALQRPITAFTAPKKTKLTDITKNKIKELEARWICDDMHFIAVVDDPGFRRVAQELVSIGKLILVRMNSKSLSILLGAQYGNVDVDEILCGTMTISSHISDLAMAERSRIRTLLINPLRNGSLCLCTDLWTDKHQQVHYLGITVSFVDDSYGLHNIDLCCYPFPPVAKTAQNIITVSFYICLC